MGRTRNRHRHPLIHTRNGILVFLTSEVPIRVDHREPRWVRTTRSEMDERDICLDKCATTDGWVMGVTQTVPGGGMGWQFVGRIVVARRTRQGHRSELASLVTSSQDWSPWKTRRILSAAEGPIPSTDWRASIVAEATPKGVPKILRRPWAFEGPISDKSSDELRWRVGRAKWGGNSLRLCLHASAVLTAYFVEGVADLPEGTGADGLQELFEDVAVVAGGALKLG